MWVEAHMNKPEIVILMGPPAAGKSTQIKPLLDEGLDLGALARSGRAHQNDDLWLVHMIFYPQKALN